MTRDIAGRLVTIALLVLLAATLPAMAVIAALWPHDVGGGDEDPYSLDGHTVSHATYSPHACDAMQDEGITEGDVEQQCSAAYRSPATAAELSITIPIATSRSLCDIVSHDSDLTAIGPNAPACPKQMPNDDRSPGHRSERRQPAGHDGQRGNSLSGEGESTP